MSQMPVGHTPSKAETRTNLRHELDKLESDLADLKVQYEQYFSGILPRAPEAEHTAVRHSIRILRKAPFRSSAINYRLKAICHRYSTYNTYWQRVLREKEEGVYVRDVFKANLRDKLLLEEEKLKTAKGIAEKGVKDLFLTYKQTLERETGKKQDLDYAAFQKALLQKAKALREEHGVKKLSFKIVVKDGKVTVQAKAKE